MTSAFGNFLSAPGKVPTVIKFRARIDWEMPAFERRLWAAGVPDEGRRQADSDIWQIFLTDHDERVGLSFLGARASAMG